MMMTNFFFGLNVSFSHHRFLFFSFLKIASLSQFTHFLSPRFHFHLLLEKNMTATITGIFGWRKKERKREKEPPTYTYRKATKVTRGIIFPLNEIRASDQIKTFWLFFSSCVSKTCSISIVDFR